ncbi:MAG: FHA domain-containing protein [Methylophilaceae bacterium]|nr:FHA domain-containing protein [Methylophilaceae bacterium]
MAKLILTLDGVPLGEYELDKELVTIGRRPSNDIHIDNLAISGNHAVVRTIGKDSFLEDLDSTNGTIVNGKPIKKHILQHGDVIELGKYQLKYVSLDAFTSTSAGVPADDLEKTMIIRPSAMKSAPLDASSTASQSSAKSNLQNTTTIQEATQESAASAAMKAPTSTGGTMLGHIQILNGPNAGRELVLNKTLTTLGKPGVQVAVITRRPQGYFITHVEGANHPIVNGQSVGAQAHELHDHDIIEIAGVKMEFFITQG